MDLREIDNAIDEIESVVLKLHSGFAPPDFVMLAGRTPSFRHGQRDDIVMSFLKCVRSVSLLHAARLLLCNGCYQEVGILSRCIGEAVEDVIFLSTPLGDKGAPSENQIRLTNEFFQEEFEDPARTLDTQKKRDRVSRDQVLAGIASIKGNGLNPSDAKAVQRLTHLGLSGYVHGAYPHIMELFGCPSKNGAPDPANGRYFMSGRMPAQRMEEMALQLSSDAERVAIATAIVTKRVGQADLTERMTVIVDRLAALTGSIPVADLNKAMKALRAKQAPTGSGKPPSGDVKLGES
ncbi:MAG: hypothetical protein ABIS07_05225 [Dokdonella sp.]